MLACGAVQKLERYGQLGLKRRSVDDFIHSSVSDPKRGNVYALTHLLTWHESYQSFQVAASSPFASPSPIAEETGDSSSATTTLGTTFLTDSFAYAMSFATSLVAHHLRELSNQAQVAMNGNLPPKKQERTGGSSGISSGGAALDGGEELRFVFLEKPILTEVFPDSLASAAALLRLLRDLEVVLSQNSLISRSEGSPFTQAYAHLLSSAMDVYFSVHTLRAFVSYHSEKLSNEEDAALQELLDVSHSLLSSVVKDFSVAFAKYPVDGVFATKVCPQNIKQQVNKLKRFEAVRTPGGSGAHTDDNDEDDIATLPSPWNMEGKQESESQEKTPKTSTHDAIPQLLLRTQLEGWRLARRLARGTSTAAPGKGESSSGGGGGKRGARQEPANQNVSAVFSFPSWATLDLFQKMCLAGQLDDRLLLLFSSALAPICTNRATRYNIYYRSDEVKLMQNNVKSGECPLFFHVTTPPVEPELLENVFVSDSDGDAKAYSDLIAEAREEQVALQLVQWMSSLPLFFLGFTSSGAWKSFAQEQRRLTLLRESETRKQHGQRARRSKDKKKGSSTSSSSSSSRSSSTGSVRKGGSIKNDRTSGSIAAGGRAGKDTDSESDARSYMSVGARSMLSTFSATSTASFLSFLSVLNPMSGSEGSSRGAAANSRGGANQSSSIGDDGDENGDDNKSATSSVLRRRRQAAVMEPFQAYESEDGNTNLPLILLEHNVIALKRFASATLGMSRAVADEMRSVVQTIGTQGSSSVQQRLHTLARRESHCVALHMMAWQCIGLLYSVLHASLSTSSAPGSKSNLGTSLLSDTQLQNSSTSKSSASSAQFSLSNLQRNLRQRAIMDTSSSTTLFNFAQDVRFNHGLGYETLGVLFAAVITPQLDLESMSVESTATEASTTDEANSKVDAESENAKRQAQQLAQLSLPADVRGIVMRATRRNSHSVGAPNTLGSSHASATFTISATQEHILQSSVRGCVAQCLAAYEGIAPQVIDLHLSAILRVSAKTVADASILYRTNVSSGASKSLLVGFLCRIIRRLGEANQLPVLLNVLVGITNAGASGAQQSNARNVHPLELEYLLSEATVRRAIYKACCMTLDPEALMDVLIHIVNDSMMGATDAEKSTEVSISAMHFLVVLCALVLEGVQPISLTAASVLERSTELEMLLSLFLVRNVYEPYFASEQSTEDEDEAGARLSFQYDMPVDSTAIKANSTAESVHPHVSRAQLRALCSALLVAVYNSRCLTEACVEDLGLQSADGYLRLFDETLWQFSSHIENVVGTLTLDDVAGVLFPFDASELSSEMQHAQEQITWKRDGAQEKDRAERKAAKRSRKEALESGAVDLECAAFATLSMCLPIAPLPTVVIPQLVLQRLSLARSVRIVLGANAALAAESDGNAQRSQEKEARRLAHYVLDYIGSQPAGIKSRIDVSRTSSTRGSLTAVSSGLREFVASLQEDQWNALLTYAKRSRLRSACMKLLLSHYEEAQKSCVRTSGTGDRSESHAELIPGWFVSCLESTGGIFFNVLTEALLESALGRSEDASVSDEDEGGDESAGKQLSEGEKEEKEMSATIVRLAAYQDAVRSLGIAPQAKGIVMRLTGWMHQYVGSNSHDSGSGRKTSSVRHRFVLLVLTLLDDILTCIPQLTSELCCVEKENKDASSEATRNNETESERRMRKKQRMEERVVEHIRESFAKSLEKSEGADGEESVATGEDADDATQQRMVKQLWSKSTSSLLVDTLVSGWKTFSSMEPRHVQVATQQLLSRLYSVALHSSFSTLNATTNSTLNKPTRALVKFTQCTADVFRSYVEDTDENQTKQTSAYAALQCFMQSVATLTYAPLPVSGSSLADTVAEENDKLTSLWAGAMNGLIRSVLRTADHSDSSADVDDADGTLVHSRQRDCLFDCFCSLFTRLSKEVAAQETVSVRLPQLQHISDETNRLAQYWRDITDPSAGKQRKTAPAPSSDSSSSALSSPTEQLLDAQLLAHLLPEFCTGRTRKRQESTNSVLPTVFPASCGLALTDKKNLKSVVSLFAMSSSKVALPRRTTREEPQHAAFLVSLMQSNTGSRVFWLLLHVFCAHSLTQRSLFLVSPADSASNSFSAEAERLCKKLSILLSLHWTRHFLEHYRPDASITDEDRQRIISQRFIARTRALHRAVQAARDVLESEKGKDASSSTVAQREQLLATVYQALEAIATGRRRANGNPAAKNRGNKNNAAARRVVVHHVGTVRLQFSRVCGVADNSTCVWLQEQMLVFPALVDFFGMSATPPFLFPYVKAALQEAVEAPAKVRVEANHPPNGAKDAGAADGNRSESSSSSDDMSDSEGDVAAGVMSRTDREDDLHKQHAGVLLENQERWTESHHRWAHLLRVAGLTLLSILSQSDSKLRSSSSGLASEYIYVTPLRRFAEAFLTEASDAVLATLAEVPLELVENGSVSDTKMKGVSLEHRLQTLLQLERNLSMTRSKYRADSHNSMWHIALDLCSLPSEHSLKHLHSYADFVDCELNFILSVLEQEQTSTRAELRSFSASAIPLAPHRLTWSELFHVLSVTETDWIPAGCLFSRSALIPSFFSTLFAAIVSGASGRADDNDEPQRNSMRNGQNEPVVAAKPGTAKQCQQALHMFTELLHQVARSCERVAGEDEEESPDVGLQPESAESISSSKGGDSPNSTAQLAQAFVSQPALRCFTLAALTSSLFQVASHVIPVFTTYSASLEEFCTAIISVLQRHALPNPRAPHFSNVYGKAYGIVNLSEAKKRSRASLEGKEEDTASPAQMDDESDAVMNAFGSPSDTAFADLAYVCVGNEDGRNLLRQTALRLQEQQRERGVAVRTDALVDGNHLFGVQ